MSSSPSTLFRGDRWRTRLMNRRTRRVVVFGARLPRLQLWLPKLFEFAALAAWRAAVYYLSSESAAATQRWQWCKGQ